VTLTQAITRSINVMPVKLSIALGKAIPKAGRAKITEVRAGFGLARRCRTRRRCRSAPTK
jgi:penicillin-binding protein 1A